MFPVLLPVLRFVFHDCDFGLCADNLFGFKVNPRFKTCTNTSFTFPELFEIKENKVVQLFESHAEALLSKEIY
jgi:hypothetical protein